MRGLDGRILAEWPCSVQAELAKGFVSINADTHTHTQSVDCDSDLEFTSSSKSTCLHSGLMRHSKTISTSVTVAQRQLMAATADDSSSEKKDDGG